MVKLTVNATSLDSGGGLSVLLGYLRGWRRIEAPLEIEVLASRTPVIEAVESLVPGTRVIPFGVGLPLWRRMLLQRSELAPRIAEGGADVTLTTNMLVPGLDTPQIVLHQNLLLFEDRWPHAYPRHAVKLMAQSVLARRAMRGSALNVFISEHLRQSAERRVPDATPPSIVIHNGVDESRHPDGIRRIPWRGEPRLLAVTSPFRHKRNDVLLGTLARLTALRPEVPWQLAVACGPELPREQALARSLGVHDRVEWLGFLGAQLDEEFARALCLLFPAVNEGFGIPPSEAMARGCPVIAARDGATPEVVGEAALLTEPGDVEACAAAVLDLYDDAHLRQQLVEAGVKRREAFRWSESARQLSDWAQRLAAPVG